ncbi:MAG: NUDIX domain-containing protein [Candidatus Paceibacterota bacterium]
MEYQQKLNKIYYFFKNPIYRTYCFIFRPKSLGVKIIVENENKVLMVRISYAHKLWSFPGGGVDKGESFKGSALRELEEEVGIKTTDLVEMGEYHSKRNFKRNVVRCFYMKVNSSFVKIDNFEISEAGWYNPDQLPKDSSSAVLQIMEIYHKFKKNVRS